MGLPPTDGVVPPPAMPRRDPEATPVADDPFEASAAADVVRNPAAAARAEPGPGPARLEPQPALRPTMPATPLDRFHGDPSADADRRRGRALERADDASNGSVQASDDRGHPRNVVVESGPAMPPRAQAVTPPGPAVDAPSTAGRAGLRDRTAAPAHQPRVEPFATVPAPDARTSPRRHPGPEEPLVSRSTPQPAHAQPEIAAREGRTVERHPADRDRAVPPAQLRQLVPANRDRDVPPAPQKPKLVIEELHVEVVTPPPPRTVASPRPAPRPRARTAPPTSHPTRRTFGLGQM